MWTHLSRGLSVWPMRVCTPGLCAPVPVSALDTHVFPVQARLAILSGLSLWGQITDQESGPGGGEEGGALLAQLVVCDS